MTTDVLIHGGTVIDPGAGHRGPLDIAIARGQIAAVGPRLDADARMLVPADGLLVVPGLFEADREGVMELNRSARTVDQGGDL